ncbi:MAG: hypothetical protein WBS22_04370 [Methylocystis sp.]
MSSQNPARRAVAGAGSGTAVFRAADPHGRDEQGFSLPGAPVAARVSAFRAPMTTSAAPATAGSALLIAEK